MFSDHPQGRDVVRVLTRAITTTSIEVWLLALKITRFVCG
jgi:hypothetical protein